MALLFSYHVDQITSVNPTTIRYFFAIRSSSTEG